MERKKGFTLVELLAVIVILAVIATIAVPIVLNIIEDARKSATKASAHAYVDAIQKKVASGVLDDIKYENKDNYVYDEIPVNLKGTIPTGGVYSLHNGVVTNGTFCINNYTVNYSNGEATVGESCDGESMKLAGSVRLSNSTGNYTYPISGTFEVIENLSGGELSCTSSDEEVATCLISGTTVTVTPGTKIGTATLIIKSAATSKYKEAQAAYVATTEEGLLSVTATGYTGDYDGEAHGITVESDNSIIMYGKTDGVYNLESSPTYTDVGTYTVYYQVTKTGYKVITGSKDVVITKAAGLIELKSTSGKVEYNEIIEIEVKENKSNGLLNVDSSDDSIASVSIENGNLKIRGEKVGKATITVTSEETQNYNSAKATYEIEVTKANSTLKLSTDVGSYKYPDSGEFYIEENESGGKLSCESSDKNVATCSISGTTVTVTPGTTKGTATLTIISEETENYNEGKAAHLATTEEGNLLNSITASGYTGVYDGQAHGITVESSGSTITYGTSDCSTNSCTLQASPTYTNVGTNIVYYQVVKAGYETVTGNKIVEITKASGSVTAPEAKELTYNGQSQELINAGISTTGTLQYKLEGGTYSTTIPTATTPGTYKVYYQVIGDGNHNDVAESFVSVTISKATLNYMASSYSGVYDGQPHGITVKCDGATITYGTSKDSYTLQSSPTYTDVLLDDNGEVISRTVYFKITKEGYEDVTGSKTVTITKKDNSLKLSSNAGNYTYPNSGEFYVEKNESGGELSCSSSDKKVATCSIETTKTEEYVAKVTVTPGTTKGTATLTIKSKATTNYNQGKAAYVATTEEGLLSVTAEGYNKEYDGQAHGITVESSGSTITYSETENGTYSSTNPTYTDAGEYTVYYKVTKPGYGTVTGNRNVVITQKGITVTATNQSKTYDGTVLTANETCSVTSGELISGHTLTCTSSGSIGPDVGTGTKTLSAVVIKDSSGKDVTNNYAIEKVNGKLTISKKSVAVTWGSTTAFTYNGSEQAPTASVTTGVTGETMTVTRTTQTNASDSSYTSTVSCSSVNGDQSKCSNYTLTGTTKAFTISRASVDEPSCTARTYNGSSQTMLSAKTSGAYTNSAITGTNAGSYSTTLTLNSNYQWSSGSNVTSNRTKTCSIGKATNPTKVTGYSGTYDGEYHNLVTTSGAQGTLYYSTSTVLTSSNYTTGSKTIPTRNAMGSYTVYWYTPGNSNYLASSGYIIANINYPSDLPSITESPTGWTNGTKTLTIKYDYDNNYDTMQYFVNVQSGTIRSVTTNNNSRFIPCTLSFDGDDDYIIKCSDDWSNTDDYLSVGETWYKVDGNILDITFTSDAVVNYILASTSVDEVTRDTMQETYVVDQFDTTKPSISVSQTTNSSVKLELSDNDSQVDSWAVSKNNNCHSTPSNCTWNGITSTAGTTVTWTASASGTYYAYVKDGAGNITRSSSFIVYPAYGLGDEVSYNGIDWVVVSGGLSSYWVVLAPTGSEWTTNSEFSKFYTPIQACSSMACVTSTDTYQQTYRESNLYRLLNGTVYRLPTESEADDMYYTDEIGGYLASDYNTWIYSSDYEDNKTSSADFYYYYNASVETAASVLESHYIYPVIDVHKSKLQ